MWHVHYNLYVNHFHAKNLVYKSNHNICNTVTVDNIHLHFLHIYLKMI